MATVTRSPSLAIPLTDPPFDLTIGVFSRMVESGLIPRERRVYLREGRLFEKMAKSKAHGAVGAAITMSLAPRLPEGWSLWPESTIALDETNAPLPDFAVIQAADLLGRAQAERYPGPGDVGLLIEVAVTRLRDDLSTAFEQYARALIPAYWVVDVQGGRILVHTEPHVVDGRGEYARVEIYRPGQPLPLILGGHEIARVPFEKLLR